MEEDNSSEARARMEIMLTDNEVDDLHKNLDGDICSSSTNEGRTNSMIAKVQRHMHLNNTKTMVEFGPSSIKPKNTSTRINRMDFGLGGLVLGLGWSRC